MAITKTLYVTNRKQWREWLSAHHKTESEVWLLWPKKQSGKPRISYNDAVEEALCFGWIDSIQKPFDDDSTAQRFSPRKSMATYSQPNIERLRKLRGEGKLMAEVEMQVKDALDRPFVFAPDIIKAIKANKEAWEFYRSCTPAYQRIRVAYIEDARRSRPEEFKKRLANFIKRCEQHKQIGYGGIDAYY